MTPSANPPGAEDRRKRERTLLIAFLLSSWGPVTTGIAVVLSRSTTQVADFVRRTTDLVALFMSWWLFRYMGRHPELSPRRRVQLERRATRAVAGALLVTSAAMVVLFFNRLSDFTPGGNVALGLGVAVLGAGVNGWFWRRYSRFVAESYDAIVHSQARLYRAKTMVDLVVVAVLSAVAWHPTHPATRAVDLGGSLVVAVYLAVSGWRSLQDARAMQPEAGDGSAAGDGSVDGGGSVVGDGRVADGGRVVGDGSVTGDGSDRADELRG